jgi:formylglycine-generating enzyme required for sulfatase activity
VPPGFVFVPAGDSQLGAADVEGVRAALSAQPQHAVHVGAFLIGVHEVTYGEYLDFLASLTGTERTARLPRDGFNLSYGVDGVPTLAEVRSPTPIRRGDLYCRSKRTARRCQDWLRFPVSSVSWQDAQAYVAWLASGRVPGARLCSEPEWERAARGADGRLYAHGDVLHPGDANFDETYAADAEQTGADEVGSFPIDRSPFLVFDLIGNVAEWLDGALRAAQGGAWSDAMFGARAGRRYASSYERQSGIGMRVCASAPTR